jgi:ketosteroid isomerase-like protein
VRTVSSKPKEADMSSQAMERELVEAENQFWRAIKDKDVDAATKLTDEPCIVTGAQGHARIDRKKFAELMETAKWELIRFELKDVQARLINPEVGVVAYKVHEEITLEGKPLTIEAVDSSTWVRRNGQWLCAVHTEALAGDPFGRDRRPIESPS